MNNARAVEHHQPEIADDAIRFYEQPFDVFSNFSAYQIEYEERVWPTSEHLYHAWKFFDTDHPELIARIFAARSAHVAFKFAQEHKAEVRPDWDDIKVGVMYQICRLKLIQHPHVRHRLEQSGSRQIVEDSPKDSFWGRGPDNNGRNELGKVWMRLREELRAGTIPVEEEAQEPQSTVG